MMPGDRAMCCSPDGVHASAKGVGAGPGALLLAHHSGLGWTFWGILVLFAMFNFRWAAGLGAWAASVTREPWLQGFCFAPLLTLVLSLAHLPLALLGHHISLSYGQSIQGWGSWFVDWGKALMLDLIFGTLFFPWSSPLFEDPAVGGSGYGLYRCRRRCWSSSCCR